LKRICENNLFFYSKVLNQLKIVRENVDFENEKTTQSANEMQID